MHMTRIFALFRPATMSVLGRFVAVLVARALFVGFMLLVACAPRVVLAEDSGSSAHMAPGSPEIVQLGAYILRVSDVSPKDGTFSVDMWVWLRWKDAKINPAESLDVSNGTITNRVTTDILDDEGFRYTSVRIQALIYHDYELQHFPMDNHTLTIEFEDSTYDINSVRYEADSGTAIDPSVKVAGWAVALGVPKAADHAYPTSYGMRSTPTPTSVYSRVTIPISLTRVGYTVLVKYFWVSALAVILSLLAMLIKSDDLDARFGLGVGSIFAASANAFVLNDELPKTTAMTMAEQINLLAVAIIFVSVFASIWSLRLRYKGDENASVRFDYFTMAALAVIYIFTNCTIFLVNMT